MSLIHIQDNKWSNKRQQCLDEIFSPYHHSTKGAFTNYVYKRRGVGGQKNRLFVNFYTIENVNGGG